MNIQATLLLLLTVPSATLLGMQGLPSELAPEEQWLLCEEPSQAQQKPEGQPHYVYVPWDKIQWPIFTKKVNGKTKYKCPECTHTSPSASNVRDHWLSQHAGIRPFQCRIPGCNALFTTLSQLKRHEQGKLHSDSNPTRSEADSPRCKKKQKRAPARTTRRTAQTKPKSPPAAPVILSQEDIAAAGFLCQSLVNQQSTDM